jgi:hypothetical protein
MGFLARLANLLVHCVLACTSPVAVRVAVNLLEQALMANLITRDNRGVAAVCTGLASLGYLGRFPFSALPCVATYCVRSGVRVVSKWPFLRLARTGTRRIENTDCRIFVIYTSGHVSRSRQQFRRILKYVGPGPLGRAANLTLSVHDLGGKVAGVEVGHEATDLAAFYLQDAHTVVGDRVPIRSTLRCPLQRCTSSVAKTFRNSDLISPKVLR